MKNRNRTIIPIIAAMLAFSAIGARLFFLQVWHQEEIYHRAQKLVCREHPEMPLRGMILDKQGRVLAMSVKEYSLFADTNLMTEPAEVERQLAKLHVSIPRGILAAKNGSSYIPLTGSLDLETVKRIKQLRQPGLGFESKFSRRHPEGKMACHILGVVGKDNAGLEGIEYVANSYLTGEKLKNLRMRDGRGREIAERLLKPEELRGADVRLTIDRNIQFIAEQEIDRAWRQSNAKKAMIIIQDPSSGEILAMASRPNYDPGDFSGSWSALKNPAVSDIFEPGSTFKAITAAAALEEKLVKRSEVLWCEDGKYKMYGHTINDHEKKGLLTFDQIMEYSSNIGFAKVSQRLGKEKLYRYIRQFGFNTVTGIDLPGEARGLLREPEKWDGLSLPTISFGQGIGVTALQISNAYAALFNGGLLLEPRLIDEIRRPDGEIIYRSERRVIRAAVSPEVANEIHEMLIGVVEKGTGRAAKVPYYSVGGKTGTAQKRDPSTKKYSPTSYIASFCGVIPANNPRMVITVVLDEPKGDYWGSSRAAPVFNKVAARAVSYLRISPDQQTIYLAKGGNETTVALKR